MHLKNSCISEMMHKMHINTCYTKKHVHWTIQTMSLRWCRGQTRTSRSLRVKRHKRRSRPLLFIVMEVHRLVGSNNLAEPIEFNATNKTAIVLKTREVVGSC